MDVLIVDDDFCSLKLCEATLKKYATHLEADSREALEAFLKIRPQLVLIDCGMPYVDGFQVAKDIRRIDNDCKIIMMSATPRDPEQIADCCDAFFMKPTSPKKINELVEKILNP